MVDDMDVFQPEPDYRNIHLQWLADDDDDGGDDDKGQDDKTDVNDKVADLEKSLKNLQKDLSGKDRKISELIEKNKSLDTKKVKAKERDRRRLEYDDMSAEELKREIERREEEIKSGYESELNEIREQNKQNEFIQSIYRLAPDIENLPPHIIKLLAINKDMDEEKLKEVMESARDEVNTLINKNRLVIDNQRKLGPKLKTGEFDTNKIPSEKEWARMSEAEQREWSSVATNDQLKKIGDSGY